MSRVRCILLLFFRGLRAGVGTGTVLGNRQTVPAPASHDPRHLRRLSRSELLLVFLPLLGLCALLLAVAPHRPVQEASAPPAHDAAAAAPATCCTALTATVDAECAYDAGSHLENYEYIADVINNCTGAVSATITWFLEGSDDPSFATFTVVDQTTPTSTSFAVGTTHLADTFSSEHLYAWLLQSP